MISDRDRELLEFENTYAGPPLRKLDQVRRLFDVTGARYIQRILTLCNQPDVEREYPHLVHRTLARVDRQRLQRDEKAQMLDKQNKGPRVSLFGVGHGGLFVVYSNFSGRSTLIYSSCRSSGTDPSNPAFAAW
jgi:hypothetical protein